MACLQRFKHSALSHFKSISKCSPRKEPTETTVPMNAKRSLELNDVDRSYKTQNRRAVIVEIESEVHLVSPLPSYEESTQSIPTTIPILYSNSPAPSYTSFRLPAPAESRGHKNLGKSPSHIQEGCLDIARKDYNAMDGEMPSLFAPDAHIVAAFHALDEVQYNLDAAVYSFTLPEDLDFAGSRSPGSPRLAQSETNRPFVEQLHRLHDLRVRLSEIPTHRDTGLEDKHKAIWLDIDKAIYSMEQQKLALYDRFQQSVLKSAELLDKLYTDLGDCIKQFEHAQSLDLQEHHESHLVPKNTKSNERFRTQIRQLELFQDELSKVLTYNDARLLRQHKDISTAVGRARGLMKRHQLELHQRSKEGYRLHRMPPEVSRAKKLPTVAPVAIGIAL